MHRYLYQAINNPVYDKLQHYILIDKKKIKLYLTQFGENNITIYYKYNEKYKNNWYHIILYFIIIIIIKIELWWQCTLVKFKFY